MTRLQQLRREPLRVQQSGVDFTFCRADEIDRLMALIDRYYQAGHRLAVDRELMAWQHGTDGYLASAGVDFAYLKASVGDNWLGVLGMIPCTFNLKGHKFPGAWTGIYFSIDRETNPGVGMGLMALAQKAFLVIGMAGINMRNVKLFNLFGFQCRAEIPNFVGLLKPQAFVLLDAIGMPVVAPDTVAQFNADGFADDPERLVTGFEAIRCNWDQTWDRDFAPFVNGTDRSTSWLRHRYAEHPVFDYFIDGLMARSGHGLAGICVSRIEKPKGRSEQVGRIIELVAKPEDATALVTAAARRFEAKGCLFFDVTSDDAELGSVFEGLGMHRQGFGAAIAAPTLYQPIVPSYVALNCGRWLSKAVPETLRRATPIDAFTVSKGDADQDRPN